MRKAGRPRRQTGYLRLEGSGWYGTWRKYSSGGSQRVTVTLGHTPAMCESEARDKLNALIRQDELQRSSTMALGPMAIPRVRRGGKALAVDIGTLGELLVCADLTAKGYPVFRAVSHVAPCDLVYFDGDRAVRVEVKSVQYRTGRTRRVVLKKDAGNFDVLALVDSDGSIEYRAHNEIESNIVLLGKPQNCIQNDQRLTSTDRISKETNG